MRVLWLALLVAFPASSAVIMHAVTTDNRVLSLHDTKCPTQGWEVDLSTTNLTVFKGCWMRHPTINEAIHIQWLDGDESIVPTNVFKQGSHRSNVSK
jgi:hypothetical protein